MSNLPHTRQLQSTEGRQWKISGATIFDIEYQGRTARVEALISLSLEDEIFLGWTILRDLISGPIYGNQSLTPNAKAKQKTIWNPNLRIITQKSNGHGRPNAKMNTTHQPNHAQGVKQQENSSTIGKTALTKTKYAIIAAG